MGKFAWKFLYWSEHDWVGNIFSSKRVSLERKFSIQYLVFYFQSLENEGKPHLFNVDIELSTTHDAKFLFETTFDHLKKEKILIVVHSKTMLFFYDKVSFKTFHLHL